MKDKLIELLKEASEHHISICSQHGLCTGCPNKEIANCRLGNIADFLLANGVTIQRWIPVEERLPENDLPEDTKRLMIRCLVFTNKGTVKPCVRQRRVGSDGKMVPWEWNKTLHARPTHWMLLPKGTKEEA